MSQDAPEFKDAKFALVWGVEKISRMIGRSERQTFHLLSKGQLPARKVGNRWVAERGQLSRFFSCEEA